MTIWKPELTSDIRQPRYLTIADAIARDIEAGVLAAGTRLPTHRDLAKHLGVTVGTVTRGYSEAERRGLTVGEVGRGTFVRQRDEAEPHWAAETSDPHVIDLSLNMPVILERQQEEQWLADTLRDVAASSALSQVLRYNAASATHRQRKIAARWISRDGFEVGADEVLVTAGAQHGLSVILSSLLRPGDVIATGELTYPGMKSLARMLGLQLRGLALDDQGIVPESLDQACRGDRKPAMVYCIPTLQNPTCTTMSEERRQAIAQVAEAHDLWIIEDDVHAFLPRQSPRPIASFACARTIYLLSVAKCLNPGLRIGFVIAQPNLRERLLSGVRSTIWMPPPLMTEITCRWMEDGTADRILKLKREEIGARHGMVREILGGIPVLSSPEATHFWLPLPAPWRSAEFVDQAGQRGVRIAGSESFAVGRGELPHAVRVALGHVERRDRLGQGLCILADLLDHCGDPCISIV